MELLGPDGTIWEVNTANGRWMDGSVNHII